MNRVLPTMDVDSDRIPRCAPNGERPTRAVQVPIDRRLRWPAPFAYRVIAAQAMLRAGATKQQVLERHGSIVLREARGE